MERNEWRLRKCACNMPIRRIARCQQIIRTRPHACVGESTGDTPDFFGGDLCHWFRRHIATFFLQLRQLIAFGCASAVSVTSDCKKVKNEWQPLAQCCEWKAPIVSIYNNFVAKSEGQLIEKAIKELKNIPTSFFSIAMANVPSNCRKAAHQGIEVFL